MKLTSQEYKDLLRRNPALAPDVQVNSQNSHKSLLKPIPKFIKQFVEGISIGCFGQKAWDDARAHAEQEASVKQAPVLKFTIPGQPVGSPRQTQRDKWMKRPCVVKYRDWCSRARASVPKGASLGLYREVSFVAYMGFPESYSVNKRADLTNQPHLQKCDVDNICKAVLDALFPEDKVIYKLNATKLWMDSKGPRIEVELR